MVAFICLFGTETSQPKEQSLCWQLLGLCQLFQGKSESIPKDARSSRPLFRCMHSVTFSCHAGDFIHHVMNPKEFLLLFFTSFPLVFAEFPV